MQLPLDLDVSRKSYLELLCEHAKKGLYQLKPGPSAEDWARCEEDLGVRLPDSFKVIATTFGPGVFGDYISLYGPNRRDEWRRLTNHCQSVAGDRLAQLYPGHEFYPHAGGILLFASFSYRLLAGFQGLESKVGTVSRGSKPKIVLIEDSGVEVLTVDFAEFLYRIVFNKPRMRGPISRSLHTRLYFHKQGPWFRPEECQ
ncbi:hypothetical protein DES53_10699 [Roseimicrobium gellanilyticum]|uniref:SMI1/KNR4 family protein n=1 Tax=Roseimicrobium gellanilyticum TaxID=748857 RepID=A0A366HKV6_9BACT|nr:SMI1/KNR4 family protein [Roseimicrobium gellanilyticum]RBP42393.1 hypothetical protein DES53_10699 [Roseimicrobium gellanilyticum]